MYMFVENTDYDFEKLEAHNQDYRQKDNVVHFTCLKRKVKVFEYEYVDVKLLLHMTIYKNPVIFIS